MSALVFDLFMVFVGIDCCYAAWVCYLFCLMLNMFYAVAAFVSYCVVVVWFVGLMCVVVVCLLLFCGVIANSVATFLLVVCYFKFYKRLYGSLIWFYCF